MISTFLRAASRAGGLPRILAGFSASVLLGASLFTAATPECTAHSVIGFDSKSGRATDAVAEAIRRFDEGPVPKSTASELPKGTVIRIGVPTLLANGPNALWVKKTVDYLKAAIPVPVEAVVYSERDFRTAVRSHHVDFFIANKDLIINFDRTTHVDVMGSLWPEMSADPEHVFASTLVMLKTKERTTPPPVTDILNRRIYATDPLSLDGWLAAEGLFLRELGRNEERWLDQTSFMERNAESVIRALKEHPEAVGVIPACQLERLIEHGQVERSDILVLNEMRNDKLACAHSTTAYPGWSFGAVQGVDPKVKKVVTAALFSMSRARYGVEWVLPVSDIPVRTLFEDLKVGPWANYQNFSLERTVREHFELFVSVILCLTMIILYALSISVVVRKRTRLLTQALAERKRIEDEVIKTREHISNLERVGIVGQMSTLIAHELKQPIGAVTNYGNGLLRRLRRGAYDPERFEQIIGEIVAQAGRASEIVDRVRAYAKQDKPPRAVGNIAGVITNAIETFRRSRTTNAEVVVRMPEECMAEIDSWGIELAILNLLKNAADALAKTAFPRIEITVRPDDEGNWRIEVADNGPYLTDEQLSRFFQPLQTSKGAKGMGLGLSIVQSIAEQHAGNIYVMRNGEKGVRFIVLIPRVKGIEPADVAEPVSVTIYRGDPDSPVIYEAQELLGPVRGGSIVEAFEAADTAHEEKELGDEVPPTMRGTFNEVLRLIDPKAKRLVRRMKKRTADFGDPKGDGDRNAPTAGAPANDEGGNDAKETAGAFGGFPFGSHRREPKAAPRGFVNRFFRHREQAGEESADDDTCPLPASPNVILDPSTAPIKVDDPAAVPPQPVQNVTPAPPIAPQDAYRAHELPDNHRDDALGDVPASAPVAPPPGAQPQPTAPYRADDPFGDAGDANAQKGGSSPFDANIPLNA